MVKVEISLDNSRIFLFPASVALLPGENDAPVPPDDTTVRGVVHISTEQRTRIGPVRVVWEVARELKSQGKGQDAHWGKRDVLATFESQVTEEDTWIESGSTSLVFTFQIPSLLPPTCETVFDRTSHTLVASVLEATPEYSLGPPPAYDDDGLSLFPGSWCGFASDWSFPAHDSCRPSLFTPGSDSRRSSIMSGRTSGCSSIVHSACPSRRTSIYDMSSRPSSIISPSSRGSVDGLGERLDLKQKKKGGLFGGFRRKDSTISSKSSLSSRLPSAGLPIVPAVETPACDGIELANWLLPSTASSVRTLEIVSCPSPKGEICTVDWAMDSHTTGLGHTERYVYSNIFSLGSAVNFDYKLTELSSRTTLHSVRLLLCQTTKAANGERVEEIFTLFSRGSAGQHVWRGEESRKLDAQDLKSQAGKHPPRDPLPQASLPGVVAGETSMRIRTRARLPTFIAGAVPSSPKLLDNRLARITHRLRIEAVFSVLGEDDWGRPLPLDSGAKDGRPAEGMKRKSWVDHEVVIGSCCITPENVLVPTYSTSPEPAREAKQEHARIAARTILASFEVPQTCTRNRTTSRTQRLPDDAPNRLARHACENNSRCLCFHGDAVVAEMIGSIEKPERHASAIPILANMGEMVKSLYIPAEVHKAMALETPAEAILGYQNLMIACS